MDELSRRVLLHRILLATASLAVAPAALSAAAESCVDPSSESLRTSLHYANPSSNSSETCKGCGFFGGDAVKPACGNCQIMSGPVDAGGHCDSWAAKS
ncbi:MAG: high-potential iron-sulfur protein [Gammaproteobacteria bacterium]